MTKPKVVPKVERDLSNFKLNDPERQEKFLAMLRTTGTVVDAANAAGISRKQCYVYRREDADFAKRWDVAQRDGSKKYFDVALEPSMRFRAYNDRIVPSKFVQEYVPRKDAEGNLKNVLRRKAIEWKTIPASDTLAMFIARAERPEKYGNLEDVANKRLKKIEVYQGALDTYIEDVAAESRSLGREIKLTREQAARKLSMFYPDLPSVLGIDIGKKENGDG